MVRPGLHRGWRILAVTGCVVYAALAIIAGLDRMAAGDVRRRSLPDWPYAIAAPFEAAQSALRRGDPAGAVRQAQTVVRHDPVNPRAISLLGASLLTARQIDAARDAFVLAERLGWRDPVTQRYWLAEALRLGDAARAARHLDALLRQQPDVPDRDTLLRSLLIYDEGRAALADRLKSDPDWLVPFVAQVDRLDDDDLDARADVVQRTGAGHWQCPQAANLIDALLAHGLLDDATTVHRTVCPGESGLVNDGHFNRLASDAIASALDWNLARRGDLVITVNPVAPHAYSVAISNTAPSTVLAAVQMTTDGPGHYRVTWQSPETSAKDAAALQVAFGCDSNLDQASSGSRSGGSEPRYAADLVVPATCPTPAVRFWLAPNHPVNLADVRISRLAP